MGGAIGNRLRHAEIEHAGIEQAEIEQDPQPRRGRRQALAALAQADQMVLEREAGAGPRVLRIDRPDDVRRVQPIGRDRCVDAGPAGLVVRQQATQRLSVFGGFSLPGERRRLGVGCFRRSCRASLAAEDDADGLIAQHSLTVDLREASTCQFVDPFAGRQQRANRKLGIGRSCPPGSADAADDIPEQAGGRLAGDDGSIGAQQAMQTAEPPAGSRDLAQRIDRHGHVERSRGPRGQFAPRHASNVGSIVAQRRAGLFQPIRIEVGDDDLDACEGLELFGHFDGMVGAHQQQTDRACLVAAVERPHDFAGHRLPQQRNLAGGHVQLAPVR